MIMKLAKRGEGQSNSVYSRSVIEYISRPTITEKLVSGHKTKEVEKCAYFSVHGCTPGLTLQEQTREFGMVADTADFRAKDVLRHYIISWPKGQEPTHEQVEMSARMFLEGIGHNPDSAQWAVGLHTNTLHKHMHIFVNRQNPETGVVTREGGGWWVREGLKSLARIEHKFNWKPEKHAIYGVNENGDVVKIRKPKSKDDRVSDRARRMEIESGHKSQERILKELCVKIRDMISAIPIEKRSWADTHRAFAQVGILYERVENKKGAVVTLDGKVYRAASSVADDFSLKSLEKLIGSTYRSPPKKDAEAMEKARDDARKRIFAAPIPLPKRLISTKSKAKYLQEWERGRFQNRLHNEQFQMRARHHNLQKMQQEMGHAPR